MDSLSPHREAGLTRTLHRFEAEYLDLNNVSVQRRREQFSLLRKFARTIDHPIAELTPTDLRTYMGARLRDGMHPNTAAKQMGMFRSFILWAYEAGLIDEHRRVQLSLVGNPRGATTKTQPNPYTAQEIADFFALLQERFPLMPEYGKGSRLLPAFQRGHTHRIHTGLWRHAVRLQFEAQIALALEAGLRRIEIHSLSIAAMHPDNPEVVVLTAKQGPGREVRRAIPYTDHARYRVGRWLDLRHDLGATHEHPWLALQYREGDRDDQLAPVGLSRFGRSLERALGTQKWRWHRFRHTAATEWLRAGVPLEKVRVFMGHSSIEQTLAYAQLLTRDVSDAFGEAEASFSSRLGLIVPEGEAA
jgi:site-specific recombinase XerD